ncbi:MAG TPA: EscF/YscF/HrpA family type III secretion system needle major subunit [Rhizomicrobium sp.]|nr:EscF/YscF/HrpA family type III secretion system needle major subunit [Rhizomicrobium sp.]
MKHAAFALAFLALATPALADDADKIAAQLTRHLNAHGRHFVAGEGARLEIGDASDSGAKDDVRGACPKSTSCFATHRLELAQAQDAMYFLSANRAEYLLAKEIEELKKHPDDPNAMIRLQQAMQKWSLMIELQNQMRKEMDEALKNIIRKM